ncbi:MAG: hypothetical protein WCT08_06455 [Patescibacteria group bacterium]|jgi:type II secretory pathway pseudopilin PulG
MKNHGVSIVEMIISITILGVISFIMVTIFFASDRVTKGQQIGSTIQTENIFGQNMMRKNLKDATGILTNVTIDAITYTTNEQNLVFKVPSINASGDIINSTWDTFVYTSSGTYPTAQVKLLISPDASSSRPASSQVMVSLVDNLQFRYNSNTISDISYVDITLRTKKTEGEHSRRFTTETRVTLRNF